MQLDCSVDGGSGLSYSVAHAWRIEGGECSSLFSVLEPGPLANATVLLRERPFERYPRVWIQFVAGRRIVRVGRDDIEAGILGTDFAYDDLRAWTPRFMTAARSVTATDGGDIVLAGQWLYRGRRSATATARIDSGYGLPIDVAWRAKGSVEPFRTLRADGIAAISGVWMPTVITVHVPGEGYTSRMKLLAGRVGRLVDTSLFEPTMLAAAADALQELSATFVRSRAPVVRPSLPLRPEDP